MVGQRELDWPRPHRALPSLCRGRLRPGALMGHFFDFFQPIHDLRWSIFGASLSWLLSFIYSHVSEVPIVAMIVPYGVAIIVITLIIRAVVAPLRQFQPVTSLRAMVE